LWIPFKLFSTVEFSSSFFIFFIKPHTVDSGKPSPRATDVMLQPLSGAFLARAGFSAFVYHFLFPMVRPLNVIVAML